MIAKNDYKRLSAKECAARLLEIKNPIVFIHVKPDGDAVGSAAALCEIFRQLGENPYIISADKIPERLKFILDNTGTAVAEKTDEYTAVAIDVASPAQLGALYNPKCAPALMIDHHALGEQFADGYIAPDASSSAEVLYDVATELFEMGKIKFTKELAFALFAAISSDTGCFAFSNASAKTHICAARLMELGIDTAYINNKLFYSKSEEQIKAEGFIASKIKTAYGKKVAYATLTLAEKEALGLCTEHFETAIDVVRSLCGVEIAFVVKEEKEGKFKASLRSTGADVASVAGEFGGGGHIRAAGCTVSAKNITEAADVILLKIDGKVE